MKHLFVYAALALLFSSFQSKAAPGDLDPTFNPTLSGFIDASLALPDGKILIYGNYTNANGTVGDKISRLNWDGTIDTNFIGGIGGGLVRSLARQPDGKVLIGGSFASFNGFETRGLVRLNSDGSVDSDFTHAGFFSGVSAIGIQSNGKILVGGAFGLMVRLNPDGTKDESFNPNLHSGIVNAIALQNDGGIIVAGAFTEINNKPRSGIARLTSTGALDESFNPGTGFSGSVYNLAVQADGRILAVGAIYSYDNFPRTNIARVNYNGSLDQSFAPQVVGGSPTIGSIFVQKSGHIGVVGRFATINSISRDGFARLNTDGSVDESFIPEVRPASSGAGVHYLPNGKILMQGAIKLSDPETVLPIVRLLGDPVLDMQRVNNHVVLSWDHAGYRLQSASNLNSEFLDVPDAASPFTNAPSGGQHFFRLFAD